MWQKELDELAKRRTIAHRLGGEKNIAKQHAHGKMTVRERIKRLCDANTFMERGMLAGVPTYDKDDPHRLDGLVPCPFIMGIGELKRPTGRGSWRRLSPSRVPRWAACIKARGHIL